VILVSSRAAEKSRGLIFDFEGNRIKSKFLILRNRSIFLNFCLERTFLHFRRLLKFAPLSPETVLISNPNEYPDSECQLLMDFTVDKLDS